MVRLGLKALFVCCFALVLATTAAALGEQVVGEAGLQAFSVKSDWTQNGLAPGDPTLGVHLSKGEATFTVRIYPASQGLRGAWTYLKYAVVVKLGGRILSDSSVSIDGLKGRRLIYKKPSDSPLHYFRVVLVDGNREFALQGICPSNEYTERGPEFVAMAKSFRRLGEKEYLKLQRQRPAQHDPLDFDEEL